MMHGRSRFAWTLGILFLLVPLTVHTQGLILPDLLSRSETGISLPIRSYEVPIDIPNQVAVTTIQQEFFNPHNRNVGEMYLLAIPDQASVSSFQMEMDEKPMQADLLDKNDAKKIYEDIVRKRKDPGMLFFTEKGLIQAKAFPIEAQSSRKIQICYEEILSYDRDVCRYQYSLATDKLCKKPIGFITIGVTLQTDNLIRNLYFPSHDLQKVSSDLRQLAVEMSEQFRCGNDML